jgi:SAM-dependent methyltransferase
VPAPHACQACGGRDLESFYEVRAIPVHSCLMVDSREAALAFPTGDLELGFCRDCGFIQNNLFDPTPQNYSPAYEETQAFSPRFMRFVDEICDDQDAKYHLKGKTVLEIGCGKGEFLVRLVERTGARGIGIDPGYRPERTRSPAADRLTFIQDFYGPKYAHLRADYVCCRHTLEHIQPVHAFMALVRRAIGEREDVVVSFELPDVERVLEERAFWDIYYEHCSYFTQGSLARLFRATGFEILELYKAYDGQYLMLEARPSARPTDMRLAAEDDLAKTARQVARFKDAVGHQLAALRGDVERWRSAGKRIAVWGSGSKAVAYLTTLQLGAAIDAVIDINPHKHGKYLAGTGHRISGPESLVDLRPDVVVVMNPIYAEEIARALAELGLTAELCPLTGGRRGDDA